MVLSLESPKGCKYSPSIYMGVSLHLQLSRTPLMCNV